MSSSSFNSGPDHRSFHYEPEPCPALIDQNRVLRPVIHESLIEDHDLRAPVITAPGCGLACRDDTQPTVIAAATIGPIPDRPSANFLIISCFEKIVVKCEAIPVLMMQQEIKRVRPGYFQNTRELKN